MERGAQAGAALARELERVDDARARALATELTYGVTRQLAALDAELRPACRTALEALQPPVRAALRLGLYQLRYLRGVPGYAAVDSAVGLARRHANEGAAGLANAVLRRLAATGGSAGAAAGGAARPATAEGAAVGDAEALAARYSYPAWMVRRWLRRLGPRETEELLAAHNVAPRVTLRAHALRGGRAALLERLAAQGVAGEPGLLPEAVRLPRRTAPGRLEALQQGLCTVQGEASMLVGHVADPRPGDRCLDVAAAPGGKATHLAERMGDRGVVVANEASPRRAELVRQAAARLGLRAVSVRVGDARALPGDVGPAFDVVVADVPCSGLGALAGRADARWRKREEDLPRLAALESELLAAAAACVRPGGRLVYSTCTTEPEENDAVVDAFLALHPDFEPEDMRERLPAALRGHTHAGGARLQLWPHRHGTEGFFVAAFTRGGAGRRAGG